MSEGGKWTPGKIILLILAILAGLCLVCGGIFYFVAGDKLKGVASLATNSIQYVERLQKEFGKDTSFQMIQSGQEFIVAIGVAGELTPERVVEIQDKAWKITTEVFAEDGFVPMKHLAVGSPASPGQPGGGNAAVGWEKNIVSVDDLVKRTGIPAPRVSDFMPDDFGKAQVKVDVKKPDETPKEDEGGKPGEK